MGRKPVPSDPLQHRVFAAQNLQILRFPNVEPLPERRQQVVIRLGVLDPLAPHRGQHGSVADRRAAGSAVLQRLPHQAVRRHVPAQRHLHGQAAAGVDVAHQAWKQVAVAVEPLQGGVGINQIGRFVRHPDADVGLQPVHRRQLGGSLRQHLRRLVEAVNRGCGPLLRHQSRDVPRAAAQVIDHARRRERYPAQQFQRRAQAVVGKLQILIRVPVGSGHFTLVQPARHAFSSVVSRLDTI